MITIIHGDDIATSRKYFGDLRDKNPDALLLDGDKITLTDLVQIFEGGGLFDDSKTVFIEQLLTKKKKGKTKEVNPIIPYLQEQAATNDIFLWEGKELDRTGLGTFKQAAIKLYKLPQTLFLFLDSIKPGNGKVLVPLFHKTIETTDAEMVFFMLVRQFRLFLALRDTTPDPIDEVKRIAPWQKSKLEKQAALFEISHLRSLYQQLFLTELGQKTGTMAAPLPQTIDFFLLEI